METVFANPVTCWLAAGALLIAVEAFTMPGLGLFLGGIGALFTAICIEAGWILPESTLAQFACCFGITAGVTAALWRPLKKFRMRGKHKQSIELNNMVGQTAIVASGGLRGDMPGQVSWSGTLMNAQLVHGDAASLLPEGTPVIIRSVSGTTVHVVPK